TGPSDYPQPQWTTAALFALALFTKVEAVGAIGAFWAFDLWQRGRENPVASLAASIRASFDRRTLTRLAPVLASAAFYFVIRATVMAQFPFADARHAPDVGASEYLATQLTAWWYYVARWVAPVRLVADNIAYPVHRSWLHPVVLLAASGWIAVGALLAAAWKRAPYLVFLAIAALALLSPTSSVAPLSEMVNEHRPYLAIAVLSLAAMIPIGTRLRTWPLGAARPALAISVAIGFLSLGLLTWRRNEVFATPASYWQDVIAKAPSARAHLNLGVALMQKNDMTRALREMRRALEFAPEWYYTHINLGVAYQHTGQLDSARAYYDRAVQYDRYSGEALTWRAEFRLSQRDFSGARDDFAASQTPGLQHYRRAKGLATAYAGLGDVDRALEQTANLLAIDRAAALSAIPGISTPFFGTPMLRAAGRRFYEVLQSRVPGQPWMAENIVRLSDAPITLASSDTSEAARMARGLDLLYRNKDARGAAEQFRKVLRRNAAHYGATYQLATALDRAAESAQARPLWEKVLAMATVHKDAPIATAARARLAR
ncbi:MAG: tetratricopeptide repeat protein, partial [Gemmatimonadaceae bacterium]